MPTLTEIQAANREAARIMEAHGYPEVAAFLREHTGGPREAPPVPYHVATRPRVRLWRSTPPRSPGVYQWRRTPQWEPITREIDASRMIYSQRYLNLVPVESLGGEWFY